MVCGDPLTSHLCSLVNYLHKTFLIHRQDGIDIWLRILQQELDSSFRRKASLHARDQISIRSVCCSNGTQWHGMESVPLKFSKSFPLSFEIVNDRHSTTRRAK